MFVIIKSPPDSEGARKGLKLAKDRAADVLLISDGVNLARKGMLEGYCGTAFVLDSDLAQRGITGKDLEKGVKSVSPAEFVDLVVRSEEVVGPF